MDGLIQELNNANNAIIHGYFKTNLYIILVHKASLIVVIKKIAKITVLNVIQLSIGFYSPQLHHNVFANLGGLIIIMKNAKNAIIHGFFTIF